MSSPDFQKSFTFESGSDVPLRPKEESRKPNGPNDMTEGERLRYLAAINDKYSDRPRGQDAAAGY